MWIVPKPGAEFVCQMEQVLGVYQRPYDEKRPVVCLDETCKQLLSPVREPVRASDGTLLEDNEYHRHGVAQLYMLFEPLRGWRKVSVRDSHSRLDWARVVTELVEEQYPQAEKITLVQDNLAAHKPAALYEILEPERARAVLEKLEFVYTPKHGSWLNMAEIELSALKRQALKERMGNKQAVEEQIRLWEHKRNEQQVKADWQFTAKDARIKLKKLYPTIHSL